MTEVEAALWACARALPALLVIPAGPIVGRLLVGLLLAAAVAPSLVGMAPSSLVGELAVGCAFGVCAAVPLYAARGAGLLVASSSRGVRPLGGATGWCALATVALAGGIGGTMRAWLTSYEVVPVGAAHLTALGATLMTLSGRVAVVGVTMALPVVGALALVDLVASVVGATDARLVHGLDALRPLLLVLLVVVAVVRPAVSALDVTSVLHRLQ